MKISTSKWKACFFLFGVALILRLFVAIFSPGTDDVRNFVYTARLTQQRLIVYKYHQAYPYPPLYAWILAGTLEVTDRIGLSPEFSVRLPSIVADSIISVLIFIIAWYLKPRAAFKIACFYCFNPITVMIASHHGQFDTLAYLPAVLAIWLHQVSPAFDYISALLLGLGGALKVVPTFLAPAWIPDLSHLRQRLMFALFVLCPLALALFTGWLMAPQEFAENVLAYRTFAEGGWGYNFITLMLERVARLPRFEQYGLLKFVLPLCHAVRSFHQYILIGGILITAWLVRKKDFIQRVFLIQLSVQLFAGRWGHEYTAWIVPLAILSNQRGMLLWGGLTLPWMILSYIGFVTTGALQGFLFRAATVTGFFSWVALGLWFISNLTLSPKLHWFRTPVFEE